MSTATRKSAATLDDLYRVEGKAELIGGRIVQYMPTGFRPSVIAARIFMNLAASVAGAIIKLNGPSGGTGRRAPGLVQIR